MVMGPSSLNRPFCTLDAPGPPLSLKQQRADESEQARKEPCTHTKASLGPSQAGTETQRSSRRGSVCEQRNETSQSTNSLAMTKACTRDWHSW